jgi:hypothetical protein
MQFLLFDHTEIQEFLHLMMKKEGNEEILRSWGVSGPA